MPTAKIETLPEGTDTVIDGAMETREPGTVEKTRTRIKEEARNLTSQATGKAREKATEQKVKATGALKELSRTVEDAAGTVDDRFGESYGEYGRMAASALASFADKLDGKEVDDLVRDASDMVRKSPVMAIGIAAVAGFAISRLVKSGLGEEQSDA